jgi:hypothetical protein
MPMTVSIRQIHPVSVFAGEVSGIDITAQVVAA